MVAVLSREFQYNDCLGSSSVDGVIDVEVVRVSIQRLFGFVSKNIKRRQKYNKVSIQRLFGFVRGGKWKYRDFGEFQYNDCLGSSIITPLGNSSFLKVSIQRLFGFVAIIDIDFLDHIIGFNTTIVWVRHYWQQVYRKLQYSFNTTIVWVRLQPLHNCISFFIVSIQRLFGFVLEKIGSNYRFKKFQYNDCLGSSYTFRITFFMFFWFQYNDCLGSSLQKIEKYLKRTSFNTTIVWVRLFYFCLSQYH